MIIFIVVLIAIICSGLTAKGKNEYFDDYCSPKNTATANAVFSVLIFLRHSVNYVTLDGSLDSSYIAIDKFLSQSVVVTYLFYSGYGIMESISKKRLDYVKRMPIDRFFKLWYHFAIMLVFFIIVSLITKKDYSLKRYLLAFTGYEAIGNYNWYMFVTFAMYIIVFVSFMVFRKSKPLAVFSVFILTYGFVMLEANVLELPLRFYDTIFCFPLGMLFSMLKPYTDKILMKNDIIWILATTAVFVVCMYGSQNRNENVLYRILFMCTAPIFITMLMMKLQTRSSILDWFGNHIFSFFMLQRIPMLLLQYFNFNNEPYLFIALSFFATVFLATLLDEYLAKLDKIIFKKKIKA